MAESLGYETTLHYGSMNYNFEDHDLYVRLSEIYNENRQAIEDGLDYEGKPEREEGIKKLKEDWFLVVVGGPLQTIITGLIGLLILFYRKERIREFGLKGLDWLAVFLALFWLREVFNLVMSISKELIFPNGSYFGGDERKISEALNLWPGTFSTILGTIGLIISVYIIFKIVPLKLRFTFILSGMIGGISGFILWMYLIGPKILP